MDLQEIATREKFIEDRKDNRTRLEGTQQSQMISQRDSNGLPINFYEANQNVEEDIDQVNDQE